MVNNMSLKTVRRMASQLLKVGENKIRMDPNALEDIGIAMTKEDVKVLIDEGKIWKINPRSPSKGRARYLKEQKKKGRRRGHGSRKGKVTAREGKKTKWVRKVRGQRRLLRELREKGKVSEYRKVYRMVKGNYFRTKRHLVNYVVGE